MSAPGAPRCPQPPVPARAPPSAGGGEAPGRAGSLGSAQLGSQSRAKTGADARGTSTHQAPGGGQGPYGSAPTLEAGIGSAEVARAARAGSIYAITFIFIIFFTPQLSFLYFTIKPFFAFSPRYLFFLSALGMLCL